MVKYEQFTRALDNIKKCSEWQDKLYELKIDTIEAPINELIDNYIGFIGSMLGDTDGYIYWWIYDCDWGTNHSKVWNSADDDDYVELKTYKDLYDFLVGIKEEHNGSKKG